MPPCTTWRLFNSKSTLPRTFLGMPMTFLVDDSSHKGTTYASNTTRPLIQLSLVVLLRKNNGLDQSGLLQVLHSNSNGSRVHPHSKNNVRKHFYCRESLFQLDNRRYEEKISEILYFGPETTSKLFTQQFQHVWCSPELKEYFLKTF